MNPLAAALVLALSPPGASAAEPAPHTVVAILLDKHDVFVGTLKAAGAQASFNGPVKSKKSRTRRNLIFNAATHLRDEKSGYSVQYQLELGAVPGETAPPLQAEGTLHLKSNSGSKIIDCGGWSVYLHLDPYKGKGHKKPVSVEGLGDYQIEADLTAGKSKSSCRVIRALGEQGSIAVRGLASGKKNSLLFNTFLSIGDEGFKADYQIEKVVEGSKAVQAQSSALLKLGKKKTVKGKGYKLDLLATPAK